ncbi:MAG: alpha-amylase family glycosyl hydrolase, partial [Oscillospiraceae bacterium]
DISSRVRHPGTFAAMVEKIPYLKQLGINCVELLPIFEFDEFGGNNGKLNLWGYSTVGFFAPKAGYAATGKYRMEVDELKNLIKKLHENEIEIILDVVFNHTAEGNENGPTISFKGLDNSTYYLLTPEGYYYNFSGCGNTFNCNNSVVRNMILECLRYWVSEYHIDGFRFDLASILSRDQKGAPMENPPLLELLAHDPILSRTKLIAEAWDAGGLYQVGKFSFWGRWAEWNGKYRDDMRQFLKGNCSSAAAIADRIVGSPSLYGSRDASVSINFLTCHDGFTLNDLVSYNNKHNESNGEDNRDGTDDNNSWNCGYEGKTSDVGINFLRTKQIKNAFTILLLSRGIPMILSGDEFANTQFGNNNAYCQDNEISWLDWEDFKKNVDVFRYVKKLIAFRMEHPVLRNSKFADNENPTGYPEISWHNIKPWSLDMSKPSLTMAIMYAESAKKYSLEEDSFIYFAMNMHWEQHYFELPILPSEFKWHYAASTHSPASCFFEKEIIVDNQTQIQVKGRSTVILLGRKPRKGEL